MFSKNPWSQIDHIKRLYKLQPLIVFLDVIQNSKTTQTNICTLLKLGMDKQDIFVHYPKARQGSFNKAYYTLFQMSASEKKKMMDKFQNV